MNCVFDGFLCGDGKWLQVIAFSAVGKYKQPQLLLVSSRSLLTDDGPS